MIKKESRNKMRESRHERIRKTLMGTSAIPRLCVFRSNTGIYAQIINDVNDIINNLKQLRSLEHQSQKRLPKKKLQK